MGLSDNGIDDEERGSASVSDSKAAIIHLQQCNQKDADHESSSMRFGRDSHRNMTPLRIKRCVLKITYSVVLSAFI
jgi:hypothetical protein